MDEQEREEGTAAEDYAEPPIVRRIAFADILALSPWCNSLAHIQRQAVL